ncbi:unnamed protein product, partial [Haemonchus placei]|uniref:Filamin-A n=1 Tax=Haemonchus placei TaxID=6290 RepID=A0A0N4X9F3_HAEPC
MGYLFKLCCSGSPFTCQLVSAAQASASGTGLERVPVDEITEIKIQTSASDAQPEVRVRDPQGNDLPVEINRSRQDETLYIATYMPKCVGNHQVGQKRGFTIANPGGRAAECNVVVIGTHEINIYTDKEKVNEMPILLAVGAGKASFPSTCLVGRRYSFDVEADNKDAVRVDIRDPHGRSLPVQIEQLPDKLVRASCRFREVGTHTIDTFVSERPVGSRIHQRVLDPVNAVQLVSELKKEVVSERAEHKILIVSGLEDEVDVTVRDRDHNVQAVTLSKISDALWTASWMPKTEGGHELAISVAGMPIAGSPFHVPVLDPSAVRVIGLRNDCVGVEQHFNGTRPILSSKKLLAKKSCYWGVGAVSVDYTQSGALSASVEIRRGSNSVPCAVKRVKPGLLMCTFTPTVSGVYMIDVHIDGLILPECPYECNISSSGAVRASGDALRRAQRGRIARFEVSLNNATRGELDVMISDPNGGPLPVRCYRQQDDSYWVEFTPEQTGTHTIEVTFGDVPVAGSPFRCEVVDPKKVKVRGLSDGLHLRHVTTIDVDRRQAGDGELTVEICDPTGTPLKVETLKSPSGEDRITFLPNQTGPHKVNVKVAGFQIPGYPQTVVVSEQPQPGVYGAAVDHSIKIDEPASLIFDPKGANGGL